MSKQEDNNPTSFAPFPGLPKLVWQFGYVICAEFRDWDRPGSEQWVEWAEAASQMLGVPARHGTAALIDINDRKVKAESSGQWRRIRNRVGATLATPALSHTMNIDSGYRYIVGEQEDDGYIYLQTDADYSRKVSKLGIVIANGIATEVGELAVKLKTLFNGRLNARYGAIYKFPKAASGNYYMMNAGYIGEEMQSLGLAELTRAHSLRAGNARSHSMTDTPYGDGFVREVFEFNLLSDKHLSAPLLGSTVRGYAEAIGILRRSDIIPGLWEWLLNNDDLVKARLDWENSGLVLSAVRAPILSGL